MSGLQWAQWACHEVVLIFHLVRVEYRQFSVNSIRSGIFIAFDRSVRFRLIVGKLFVVLGPSVTSTRQIMVVRKR